MSKENRIITDDYDFNDFDKDIADLMKDPGQITRELLLAGHEIYYSEPNVPDDCCIREYPSGRKELVRPSSNDNLEFEILEVLCNEEA